MSISLSTESVSLREPRVESLQPHEALIFIHLMKTGGTSLFKLLRRQYPKDQTFHYGQKPGRTLEDFDSLPQAKRDQLRFIHGHISYGFHERLTQPNRYVTMLRKPVNRIVSLYYFLHQNPNRYVADHLRCPTLRDYLESGTFEVDNGQTRRIAGAMSHHFRFGECTPELLEIAKQNLSNFVMVGTTERFDESLVVLKNVLSLTQVLYSRFNENYRKPKLEDIDPRDIDCIKAHSQLDEELYAYANQLLDEKIHQLGEPFQIEYTFFRQANRQFADARAELLSTKTKLRKTKKKLKQARKQRKELRHTLNESQQAMDAITKSKFWKVWQWLRRLKPNG